MIAERAAKSCLLVPSAVGPGDLTLAAQLAEKAVALGKDSPWLHWFQLTEGLADYRRGRFTGAVEQVQLTQQQLAQARDAARARYEADTYFVLAMARQQLKQGDQARAALARGLEIVQTNLSRLEGGDLGAAWYDVLMTYILMREADTLLNTGAQTAQETKPAQ